MNEMARTRATKQAADWLVRLSAPGRTAAEQEAFEDWLADDPAHGEIYEALSRTWEDTAHLSHLASLATPRASLMERALTWFAERRPWLLGAGVGVVAASLAVALVAAPMLAREPTYQTEIAEIRPITLPDGTVVTLGARSALDIAFTPSERRVRLSGGEAFFEVAHNPERPFLVQAGDADIRVVGTKFDVRHGAEGVEIAVLEGIVDVRATAPNIGGGEPPNRLRAGERAAIERRPMLSLAPASIHAIEPISTTQPGAWRDGRLAYNDAPLRELVADLNRYYAPGVRLASPETGDIRVTTAFRTSEIPAFLDALGVVLPVEVTRERDERVVVSARAR